MLLDFEVGQKVELKKQHPCGGTEWEIQRVGMDFRIKCLCCGHSVMVPRARFEKSLKKSQKKPSL
ncbi:MAG: DUF951 domain-containing protein [Clostridiales bacterium]|nr:DUF951 domain-containing protein [Clostridiales bacterium]MDR2752481.1 DUF951 domain-containing protein [Clostridiales bacterium]